MGKVIHRANGRGIEDKRWIKSYHTFSYGSFYDPRRINFGALRVLSDNIMEGGEGFGSHTHDNMELITIPLNGALEEGDHQGNISVMRTGEAYVLSAGTSIQHNEYNQSHTEPVRFLRIWIYPSLNDIEPRYSSGQVPDLVPDVLTTIVAPYEEFYTDPNEEINAPEDRKIARISQQAWIYMAWLSQHGTITHKIHEGDFGAYLLVLEGEVSVEDTMLTEGDSLGVWHTGSITIESHMPSKIIMIEIPNKN